MGHVQDMKSTATIVNIAPVRGVRGFTLVELVLTLLISAMIVASIYSAYKAQQKSQTAQDQVVEMQQNLRAGINFLASEMRMAGHDPVAFAPAGAGIVTATRDMFQFTADSNANSDTVDAGEQLLYGFNDRATVDADNDGVADGGGVGTIGRKINVATSAALPAGDSEAVMPPIVDNVCAFEFLYVLADTNDNGIYDPVRTLTPTAAELDEIRAVTISILTRADDPDQDFDHSSSYSPKSCDFNYLPCTIWGPYTDNFRHRLLITTVQLRNMGL